MRWDIAIGVAVGIIVGELVVRALILLTGLGDGGGTRRWGEAVAA